MATTKATPPAKSAGKPAGIVAYCVKTKEKNVPMLNAVINVSGGKYVAVGVDAAGNKMAAIMNKATAEGHVANGNAKKGEGWEVAAPAKKK